LLCQAKGLAKQAFEPRTVDGVPMLARNAESDPRSPEVIDRSIHQQIFVAQALANLVHSHKVWATAQAPRFGKSKLLHVISGGSEDVPGCEEPVDPGSPAEAPRGLFLGLRYHNSSMGDCSGKGRRARRRTRTPHKIVSPTSINPRKATPAITNIAAVMTSCFSF